VLSDEPRPEPRLIRSRHFSFLSDVSDREAKLILDKLETMVGLLERYFGRRQRGVIEGFIVHDLAVWPEGVLTEPLGIEKIKEPAGICFTTVLGPHARAVLYACDDPGIIQHECTHGFCHLTFGGAGPLWLAEGLAEVGRWWREKEKGVNVAPVILAHLHDADRPTLAEITAPNQPPSNDWRDYTWRYALCQMLLDNPNYADRFRGLAVALMEGQPGASFESVYGPVSREVAFEFGQFLSHIGTGYRADLTAWPWKAKQRKLAPGGLGRAKVKGAAGWQASGVEVEAGAVYVITAEGACRMAADAEPTGPDAAGLQARSMPITRSAPKSLSAATRAGSPRPTAFSCFAPPMPGQNSATTTARFPSPFAAGRLLDVVSLSTPPVHDPPRAPRRLRPTGTRAPRPSRQDRARPRGA
jgi:hypothetical protein